LNSTSRVPTRNVSLTSIVSFCVLALSGCGSGLSAPTVTTQPANTVTYALQTATFRVDAKGGALTYQWQKNGTDISGATAPVYTTPNVTMADNGAQYEVTVTNAKGKEVSNGATLTVTAGSDAPTYHYDNMRSGQNVNEKVLTKALVNFQTFGLLGTFTVDGLVDGEPLYLSNVTIPKAGPKNVLYVVTEHGSVFAFDAESANGTTTKYLWKTSTVPTGELPDGDHECAAVTPEIGITSTPVIDRGRGAMYVVAATQDSQGNTLQRLHALDLTTGAELFGGPTTIVASYAGTGAGSSNGTLVFDPSQYLERSALLEVNGTIFLTWASHCDNGAYTSWVMSYNADTLQQSGVLNLVPNGSDGGIWMSGAGPAADANGNIFLAVGNGTFDTTLDASGFPIQGDVGNCFVKISSTAPLKVLDYFTPADTASESATDHDFGSGGPLLVDAKDASGTVRHLAISGSKGQSLYIADRDSMGQFDSDHDNIYQELVGAFVGGVYSKASYFNGTVYIGVSSDAIKAFPVANGKLGTAPASASLNKFYYPGATPTISANGTDEGIVWAIDNGPQTGLTARLFVYDASNLATELYDSTQAPQSRDEFNNNKFITPLVINGKVFLGTSTNVAVFGLLP
jgi:hypothetical protein